MTAPPRQLDLFPPARMCRFYLGTHQPHWLGQLPIPMFVSRRRLAGRRSLPRATAPWALDSGGFTELNMYGRWETPAAQYAEEVRRLGREVGLLAWAAIQDWMCEPYVLKRTAFADGIIKSMEGPSELTPEQQAERICEHQRRTIRSYLELRDMAPEIPWTPVVQGWECADYHRHVDEYASAGVDLTALAVVGVGSVCRRQHSSQALEIFRSLAGRGLRLHGFGLKLKGLERAARYLVSSDSLAWSYAARRDPALPGCHGHKNCANCARYAMNWRGRVVQIAGVA